MRRLRRRHSAPVARLDAAALATALLLGVSALLVGGAEPVRAQESAGLFDRGLHADVLGLVPADSRDAFAEALADAGRNWSELARAVRELDGAEREAAVWLLDGMPHLDRLEMTASTLGEHVRFAFRAMAEAPYAVPGEMFRPYILTYRIEEEPVDAWRAELFARFWPLAVREGTVDGTARAVNAELASSVVEREREFFGPQQSPLLTLRSGRGTESEIAVLACAAMKAVGIPSRQVNVPALGSEKRGASWIEVFSGDAWLPMYPLEPEAFGDFSHVESEHWRNVTLAVTRSSFERLLVTERYTETGTIELSFVSGGKPAARFEHFAVSVLNDGALVPLDDLEAVADEDGTFTAVVGNGRYVVQAGSRDADGNAFVMMKDLVVLPGATRRVAFDVSLDDRGRTFTPEEMKRFEDSVAVWVAFDLEGEPSLRMLPLIANALERRAGVVEARFTYMGPDPDSAEEARAMIGSDADIRTVRHPSEWYYVDETGDHHGIGPGAAELPVVRVYQRHGGRIILHSEGYDLNIERKMTGVIDDYLEELLSR